MEIQVVKYLGKEVSAEYLQVVGDILSHAITGELVGMQHFASMVPLAEDREEKFDLLDHALSERGHAVAFEKVAKELGLPLTANPNAPYWKRIGDAFAAFVAEGNFTACLLAQEAVLESLAVGMYLETGKALDGKLGEIFTKIGEEEKSHMTHSIDELREAYEEDPTGFVQTAERVHNEVMMVLGEMTAKVDHSGHCEICNGNCIKESLSEVNLKLSDMRGATLYWYLHILDEIGLPGDLTLKWVSQMPS